MKQSSDLHILTFDLPYLSKVCLQNALHVTISVFWRWGWEQNAQKETIKLFRSKLIPEWFSDVLWGWFCRPWVVSLNTWPHLEDHWPSLCASISSKLKKRPGEKAGEYKRIEKKHHICGRKTWERSGGQGGLHVPLTPTFMFEMQAWLHCQCTLWNLFKNALSSDSL